MQQKRYEKIKKLIEENADIVEFGDFGEGVSEEWACKAEKCLGMAFPPPYRWWLLNYGGGEIAGEEVFSVYEEDFNTVVGGDVVYIYRLNLKNGLLSEGQISVCESDLDGLFFLDMNSTNEEGEAPVCSAVTGAVYASDFLEFLEKRIVSAKEGAQ